MTPALVEAAKTARAWAVSHALPLWMERGWDQAGGFVERLSPDGAPDRFAPRRVRVQARQIAVFAQAALAGWSSEAGELSRRGLFWFLDACRSPHGPGFVHIVDHSGRVLDARRDTYDQAFALFALAWSYRLSPDAGLRAEISALVDWLESDLFDKTNGGFWESDQRETPRRQNPHMHLFEAMLTLFDATRDPAFLARADHILSLFTERFWDAQTGVLREYFTQDWRAAPGDLGHRAEPGHHYEWIWLLAQYDVRRGADTSTIQRKLRAFADRVARAPSGFIVDEAWSDGRIREGAQRFWPQTEYVKARLAFAEHGEQQAADDAATMIMGWFGTFLAAPVLGGWRDRFAADGGVLDGRMPASTGYHVFTAIHEAERVALQNCM